MPQLDEGFTTLAGLEAELKARIHIVSRLASSASRCQARLEDTHAPEVWSLAEKMLARRISHPNAGPVVVNLDSELKSKCVVGQLGGPWSLVSFLEIRSQQLTVASELQWWSRVERVLQPGISQERSVKAAGLRSFEPRASKAWCLVGSGQENGNFYNGLYRSFVGNGKENGNYYNGLLCAEESSWCWRLQRARVWDIVSFPVTPDIVHIRWLGCCQGIYFKLL